MRAGSSTTSTMTGSSCEIDQVCSCKHGAVRSQAEEPLEHRRALQTLVTRRPDDPLVQRRHAVAMKFDS